MVQNAVVKQQHLRRLFKKIYEEMKMLLCLGVKYMEDCTLMKIHSHTWRKEFSDEHWTALNNQKWVFELVYRKEGECIMKRRVLKKKIRRTLNEELPATFKLSVMQELIKLSQRSSWFQIKDYPYVRFERFQRLWIKAMLLF